MQTTPRCAKVLANARESLVRFGHSRISSAHLVLGLLALGNGMAVNILQRFGCSAERVELYLISRYVPPAQRTDQSREPYDESAVLALKRAEAETLTRRHSQLGVECVLLGILAEERGPAAALFASLAVDRNLVKDCLAEDLE